MPEEPPVKPTLQSSSTQPLYEDDSLSTPVRISSYALRWINLRPYLEKQLKTTLPEAVTVRGHRNAFDIGSYMLTIFYPRYLMMTSSSTYLVIS
jgi:hypothetical protein